MNSHIKKTIKAQTLLLVWLFSATFSLRADVLFQDNFNSGVASPEWASINCCQQVKQGGYHTKDTNGWPRDSMAVVHDADTQWQDYKLSLNAQFVDSTVWDDFTILLRSDHFNRTSAGTHGKAYQLIFQGEGFQENSHHIHLYRTNCSSGPCNQVLLVKKAIALSAAPMAIEIVVNGGRIRLVLDGTEVFDIIDPNPLTYGGVGIHSVWEAEARFDNVLVSTLEPAPLNAVPITPNAIRLSWYGSSAIKGFRIQRKEGACNSSNPWLIQADTGPSPRNRLNSFLDNAVSAENAYAYKVVIFNGDENFSDYSECASATTPAKNTPPVPLFVRAVSKSDSQIVLTWHDNSEIETNFKIYRQTDNGNSILLNTVQADSQRYEDNSAPGNTVTTSYRYDVRACNQFGCSTPNTSAIVPFKPTALRARGSTTIRLDWKDNSNDENGFEVWRKNGTCATEKPWVVVKKPTANATVFNDNSTVRNTEYAYRVRAYSTSGIMPQTLGYSLFSGCVSALVP